jgi:hypothetical protein
LGKSKPERAIYSRSAAPAQLYRFVGSIGKVVARIQDLLDQGRIV